MPFPSDLWLEGHFFALSHTGPPCQNTLKFCPFHRTSSKFWPKFCLLPIRPRTAFSGVLKESINLKFACLPETVISVDICKKAIALIATTNIPLLMATSRRGTCHILEVSSRVGQASHLPKLPRLSQRDVSRPKTLVSGQTII